MSFSRLLLRATWLLCTCTALPAAADEPPVDEPPAVAPPPAGDSPMTVAPPVTTAADAKPPVATVTPDPMTQAEVRAHLESGRFRFCTNDAYRLWQLDKERLCSRLPDVGADCPGLAAACARPAWDETPEAPPSSSLLLDLANWLGAYGGSAFRAVFWLALALGALYLVRALLRVMQRARDTDTAAASVQPVVATDEVDEAGAPAGLLLDQAAMHLEAGDARRALHFAYAALLAGLAQAGVLRVHRALTSGDYRRSLARSHPESPAGGLLWDLDLARFRSAVDADAARRLTLRVRDLLSRSLVLLLVSGSGALSGCANGEQPEAPAEPTGPRGFALFEELAAREAATFSRRLRRITELPSGTTAVVLVSPNLRELEWTTLKQYVEDGGHLIAAGKAEGLNATFDFQGEAAACTAPIHLPEFDIRTADTPGVSLDGLAPNSGGVLIATCGSVDFARTHVFGKGHITLVGDAGFFDNTSLSLAQNANLALALIESPPGHMEFVGPWTGTGAVHPLESIARSSVGAWLLHLLLVLALLAWSRGRRFGQPRPPLAVAPRSLLEHAFALAGHYQRQGDVGAALARYANWAVAQLGKRSGSSQSDLHALALALVGRRNRAAADQPDGAADLHQILLRARAAAELGGDKAKLMRAYRILRRMVSELSSQK